MVCTVSKGWEALLRPTGPNLLPCGKGQLATALPEGPIEHQTGIINAYVRISPLSVKPKRLG